MRRRSLVGAAVATALGLAACGGPAQPGSTASTPPAPRPSTSSTAAAMAGSFRACHQTTHRTTVMILFFSSSDPAIAAAGSSVVFDVAPIEPATWTSGEAVHLRHGAGWNARRWAVIVPGGVVPPAAMTLRVSATSPSDPAHALASATVNVSIPSSACSFS